MPKTKMDMFPAPPNNSRVVDFHKNMLKTGLVMGN